MRIAVIAFTARGGKLALRLCKALEEQGHGCAGYIKMKDLPPLPLRPVNAPCAQWAGERFGECDALIFVGACGIAVRAVAPWVKDKARDPAVLVLDEGGKYVISLLSGHLGGANELARLIARITGGEPVITTATDGRGVLAVDRWAQEHGFALGDLKAAKAVSAALLAGKPVGVYSDLPLPLLLPRGMEKAEGGEVGVAFSLDEGVRPFDVTLPLIPRAVILGIGCRRGTQASAVEEAVNAALAEAGVSKKSVCGVATIDLKAGEPGLLCFCESWGVPLTAFSAGELAGVPGEYTASAFVKEMVGVDNVCERAAVLASGGKLLFPKRGMDGVTVAAALQKIEITFEE
ncbi:cobalt-precorrin 5A hydrolase [Zongyangia hominis]|uniref:Cobalt-precorrin 5A hydrolase n=1 Tax=Zongyangia hominis TaxID=2763677 RepID=A0A926ECL4_9FIRM|nr:cobalt-precorrin 5A hydrolase [Zongyangia hominis]MBC8569292.1 cobalt-precorrin 5A hydrolase [Zongyangia hominis]